MRVVVQRVSSASVKVGDELVSSIGRGICVLVGIRREDKDQDLKYICNKLLNLKLFEDGEQRWKKGVKDSRLEILCVSQFTLCATLKGNKPDFHQAMGADQSRQVYEKFLDLLQKSYDPCMVKDGRFGAYMSVEIQNDGPVTIILESGADKAQSQPEEE